MFRYYGYYILKFSTFLMSLKPIRTRSKPTPHQQSPAFYAANAVFPPGWCSSRECYTQWVVSLTLQGVCRYRFNGNDLWAASGDLIFMRPATEIEWLVPQSAESPGWNLAYSVFAPRPHWQPWLQFPEIVPGAALLRLGNSILYRKMHRLFLSMCKQQVLGSPRHDEWAMLLQERILLTLQDYCLENNSDPRVLRAMELLSEEYAHAWSIDELAARCHTSVSHLTYLFRRDIGMAPLQYLEQTRMQRAMARLALGHASIAEIASDLGFAYPSYFARRFRRYTGQSPGDYRLAARQP